MTWNKQPIHPHLSQDNIADFIESGELKIVDLKSRNVTACMWADKDRKEAKDPIYQKFFEALSRDIEKGNCRII